MGSGWSCPSMTALEPIFGQPRPPMENSGALRTSARDVHLSPGEYRGRPMPNGCLLQWAKAMPTLCRWKGCCNSAVLECPYVTTRYVEYSSSEIAVKGSIFRGAALV